MREELLDYLQSENLGVFTVTRELPWDDNGVALYLKNLKKIYASPESQETVPIFQGMDGSEVSTDVTTVTVYFANDAKQTPPNLDEIITAIKAAKDIDTIDGIFRREVTTSKGFEADVLVNELEFRFSKITT
jgi:hypothetical protein